MTAPTKIDLIAAAHEKAEAAKAEVNRLRDAVMAGDSKVTPSMLADAASAAAFSELGIEAALKKADSDAEAKRLAAIGQLDNEIDTYRKTDGATLVNHLKAAESAIVDYLTLIKSRETQNGEWQARRWQLTGDEGAPVRPLADIADGTFIVEMVAHAAAAAGVRRELAFGNPHLANPAMGWETTYQRLAAIDGPVS